jgi:hypothetical protein
MSTEANQGVAGDIAKLMMHRLIVRQIRRDPTLVERAKMACAPSRSVRGLAHRAQVG